MQNTSEKNLAEKHSLPLLEISEPAEWDAFREALGTGSKSLKLRFQGMVIEFNDVAAEPEDLAQFLSHSGDLGDNLDNIMAHLMSYSGPTNPFNRWKWNNDYPNSLDYLYPDGSLCSTTRDIDTLPRLFDEISRLGKKSWVGKKDLLTILTLYCKRFAEAR
jgi:hypothetical protein